MAGIGTERRVDLAEQIERLLRREAVAYLTIVNGCEAQVLTATSAGAKRTIELVTHRPAPPRLVRITVEVVE